MTNSTTENTPIVRASSWYANCGWDVFPVHGIVDGRCTCNSTHPDPKSVGKHPRISEWQKAATHDAGTVQRWWEDMPTSNIGVMCKNSGFFVIDFDPRNAGINAYEKFEEMVSGNLPPTVEAVTGEYFVSGQTVRGRHLFYKCADGESLIGNLAKSNLPGVDIKHNGYILIAPSQHFSGVTYEWLPGHAPWEIDMAEASDEILAVVRKRAPRTTGTALGVGEGSWGSIFGDIDFSNEKVDISKMLEDGLNEGSRAVDIYKLACALANKFPVNEEAGRMAVETLMIRFNYEKVRPPLELEGPGGLLSHVRNAITFVLEHPKTSLMWEGLSEYQQDWANKSQAETTAKYAAKQGISTQTGAVETNIRESFAYPGTPAGAFAKNMEDTDLSIYRVASNINVPLDPDALYEEDGGDPNKRSLTDTGNGRRFVDNFGKALRYTPGMGWHNWDSGYWKQDHEKLAINELSKRLASLVAGEVVHYSDEDKKSEVVKWAHQSKSNARLHNAIDSANSDPRIYVDVDSWDADPHLLGVMNGVIDIRTGELLKGRPDLYITRRAPVAYTPGLKNAQWETFLDFATGGDTEFKEWLQRAAGYTLTGLNKYDILFLVYGPAGSGKNTLVEALVKVLGTQQYSWPLDPGVLAQGDGRSTPQDQYHWAELRGRRMVWVDELPDSERVKENQIKRITGSDMITGRSPGERPFNFKAQAKLWITTNHRPIITDDAMWRRIRPIPLDRVPEKPDPNLKEYIFDPEGGLPAVLAWAVEGAIKMLGNSYPDGVGWCDVVAEAAAVYRKNEDRIGIFFSEETSEVPGSAVPVKHLYGSYRVWSEDRGERPMSQQAFQRKMAERGMDTEGTGSRAILKGYVIVPRVIAVGEIDWDRAARMAILN